MAKTPQTRGFTLAEKRSLQFERVSLYAVLLVAVIAAVISFQAQWWFGIGMGLAWAAPLVPIAIDGFAIACSVGIVRSQAAGEPAKDRMSEWIGLSIALGLSIAVNVQHTLVTREEDVPRALAALVAASIPVVLAYGIHVYGRAMSRGLSAHVMADDPSQLHFDVAHLGDAHAPTPSPVARPARTTPRVEAPRVERVAQAAPAHAAVAEARAELPTSTRLDSAAAEAAYAEYAQLRDEVGQEAAEQVWDGSAVARACGMSTAGAGRNKRNKGWRVRYAQERGIELEAAESVPAPQAMDDRETTAA